MLRCYHTSNTVLKKPRPGVHPGYCTWFGQQKVPLHHLVEQIATLLWRIDNGTPGAQKLDHQNMACRNDAVCDATVHGEDDYRIKTAALVTLVAPQARRQPDHVTVSATTITSLDTASQLLDVNCTTRQRPPYFRREWE